MMKRRRYTNEMFDAICRYVDGHPGCTAREAGNNVYPEFHPGSSRVPPLRIAGRIRDWTRGLLRVLGRGRSIRTEQDGQAIHYYLVDDEEETDIN